jgi:simple sugar transport system permease protein
MQQTQTTRPARPKQPFYLRLTGGDSYIFRLLLIAILLFIAFSLALPGKFATVANLKSMAVQFPEYGILALGIFLAMITGGIDLSAVGTANLSAIFAALTLTRLAGGGDITNLVAVGAAVAVALVVGTVTGLFNGFLIARVGIVPILATLGTMSLYMGFGYVITGGPAVQTTQLAFIGNGQLLGIPIPFILFIILALLVWLLLSRTAFGFRIYMVGSNAEAARFSGIDNARVLVRTYWVAGLLAALGGLVFLARTNQGKPDYGESFVLLAVLISILGGVGYSGGSGKILGVVLAIFCLQLLSSGINMLLLTYSGSSAATFFKQFAWGALLLLAMVINTLNQRRQERAST